MSGTTDSPRESARLNAWVMVANVRWQLSGKVRVRGHACTHAADTCAFAKADPAQGHFRLEKLSWCLNTAADMVLRRNILVFHMGALGDFIVTWPLALALARLHPQSRVFYVTHGEKGALAEKVLRVESLDIESGGWHQLFSTKPGLPASAARALEAAHTVVSFISAPDDQWCRNVKSLNPDANLLTLSTSAPPAFAGHQTDFLMQQLSRWPAAGSAVGQILRSIAERGLASWSGGRGPILVHPGSGSPDKCWPAERYLEFVERLRAEGQPVRVLLGEVELERWPASQIKRFKEACETCAPANLLDLLNRMTSASAFIGNDSGPGHLAGILGIPTLSLFGKSSNTQLWRPLGPRVRVLSHPLQSLGVEEVDRHVKQLRADTDAGRMETARPVSDEDE